MTRRRMKSELVSTEKRNQTAGGMRTSECRWQMYFPSPSVTMVPASCDLDSGMRFKKSHETVLSGAGRYCSSQFKYARMSPGRGGNRG